MKVFELIRTFLNDYSKVLGKQIIARKEQSIHKEAGARLSILLRRKQVGEVLFVKMQIPYRWRKTASGQFSTNEEKLSELAQTYPFVQSILDYRKLAKLKSTYVDTLTSFGESKNRKST